MLTCAEDSVSRVESLIAEKVGPQRFNVWFKNATRFSFTDEHLHVSAPNHFIVDWLERHFADVISEAAQEVGGREFTLSFAIDPQLPKGWERNSPTGRWVSWPTTPSDWPGNRVVRVRFRR